MDMIYTYGGGHVLYKIFNGIAALCASNSPYFTAFLTPALLIGGIWGATIGLARADLGLFARKWYVPTYVLLTFLLVPKTTIWIKDEVDPTFGSDKVDNIPVGLALVAGATSTLARGLTELIEASFPSGDITKFSKTGYAFTSRLMQEARTMRISDPTLLENIKDWTHQCLWLPYLKTNIKGKREEVRKTNDLVTWVEGKSHPSLGVYWRNADGSKVYQTCRAAAPLVRKALQAEQPATIHTLAARLFGFSSKDNTGEALKPYMEEAWNLIGKSTQDTGRHIQQMLVVNALKEGFDDGREKAGYRRLHPELVSINAARSMEAQGMTGLIKGFAASVSMPLLQAFLFGLLSILFFLVIPFCFMPGGISIFGLWVKMVFAVQLWPVFSTILNAVSIIWMDRASESLRMAGEGFSIATTTGLADAAFQVASWSAGMQMLVPVLAWAFVSKSGYALTNVFQGATGGIESNAARLGSETVDGNVSLNNLSMMNRNLATESIAQQSWGSNMNFGSTLNTGDRSITNTLGGDTRIQENLSKLGTDITSSDSLAASVGSSYRESEALTLQKANTFNKTLQDTSSEMLSWAERLSKGINKTEGMDEREQASIQRDAQEFLSAADALKKDHNISANTAAKAALGGTFGKVLGKLGVTPELGASAQDQEAIDKAMNTDAGQRFTKALGKMNQYAKQHGTQIQDSSGQEGSSSLQHNLSKLQSEGEALSRSYTKTQNIEKLKSFTENHSFGASSNENDEFMAYAAQKLGRDIVDTHTYLSQNKAEEKVLLAGYMDAKKDALMGYVEGADHALSDSDIQSFMSHKDRTINSEGRDVVQLKINESGFRSDSELRTHHEDQTRLYEGISAQNEAKIEETQGVIQDKASGLQGSFDGERVKMNVTRLGEKGYNDTKNTWGETSLGKQIFEVTDSAIDSVRDAVSAETSKDLPEKALHQDSKQNDRSDEFYLTQDNPRHSQDTTIVNNSQPKAPANQEKLEDMNKKLRK